MQRLPRLPRLRRPSRVALAALVVATLCSGCVNLDEMQFTKDERLTFTAPADYEQVQLPVTISWKIDDFEVIPKGTELADVETRDDLGYFAVFVDRAPVKPGRSLKDVGNNDKICESNPACPDRLYLNSKGVYITRQTTISLPLVAPLKSKERIQLHEVTVVLMNADGRRIGESAWFQRFRLENKVIDL